MMDSNESDLPPKSTKDQKEVSEPSNFCNTPVLEVEAPLSPVLTNSKKSLRHIARRKSRIKLMNKFSQNSLMSQETCTPLEQSQVEEKELILSEDSLKIPLKISIAHTDVIKKENYKDNELEDRMKRCIELQRNKKFCYTIAANSSKTSESHDSNFKVETLSKIDNLKTIEPFIANINITDHKSEDDFNFKIPESPVSLSKSKKCVNILVKTEISTNSERNMNLNVGFETGSGKKINLSEKALKRAAKLFDDIIDISESSNYEELKDKKIETSCNKNENHTNIGFKTAAGNSLKLSENSMKKVQNLFDDIYDLSNYNESQNDETSANVEVNQKLQNKIDENIKTKNALNEIETKKPTEFKKLSQKNENKLINKPYQGISPENKICSLTQITDTQMCWAAENAECMAEFLNTQWTPSPKDKSQNLKTQLSSEKKINKSQDNDEFVSPESDQFFGNLTVCEDGTVASRNSKINPIAFINENIANSAIACGKTVSIIEESLNKVKHIFDGCDFVEENVDENIEITITTFSGNKITMAEDIPRKDENSDIGKDNIEENKKMTAGFSTASGKKVLISEESLKKANHLFQDCDIVEENVENISVSEKMAGTSQDCDIVEENIWKNGAPQKTTACSKKVSISEESLNKIKNIEEIPKNMSLASKDNLITEEISGTISDDTFESNKEIFEQISMNQEEKQEYISAATSALQTGFCTASGSNIVISEDMLRKARSIFEDTTDLNEENLVEEMLYDFTTPSASFTILEKSFSDEKNNLEGNENLILSTGDDTNSKCCGFTWDESLKSIKIYELYKRSFKHIEKNIKKNIFYPFSFTFDDIQSSKEYKNKNYKYALRFKKKSSVIYGNNNSKSRRSQRKSENGFPVTPELLNTSNIVTRSRRNLTIEDISPSLISNILPKTRRNRRKSNNTSIDNNLNVSSESNKTNSKYVDNKKTIEDLENDFLSCIENTFKEATKNSQETSTTDSFLSFEEINSFKEEFSDEASFDAKISPNKEENSFYMAATKSIEVFETDEIELTNNLENVMNSDYSSEGRTKLEGKEEIIEKEAQILNNCNEELKNNVAQIVTPKNSNKSLLISESAKNNVINSFENKIIFDDIEKENVNIFNVPKTELKPTEENLKKAEKDFQYCDIAVNVNNNFKNPTNTSFGFATASGKKVKISEDALKKAKSIFQDCEITEEIPDRSIETINTESFGLTTEFGNKVAISEDALKKAKNIFQDSEVTDENLEKISETPKNMASFGFATASGKKVTISEDALKKAKNIFQDCEVTDENLDKISETPKSMASFGFATASGTKVAISNDALKKVKSIFRDTDITEEILDKNTETPKNTESFGFATASGKKVAISEDALKKAKNLFQDCDITEENPDKNTETPKDTESFGFATASGEKVEISKDALKKAKSIFQDWDTAEKNIETPKNTESFGFATASGKTVAISKDALKKAKSIFQDCDMSEEILDKNVVTPKNSKSLGFATASNKEVAISEDALKKVKNIFQYSDTEENLNKNMETPKNMTSFGFATASGKKVAISEDALKKAKNIFQDCDTEENLDINIDPTKSAESFGCATASGKTVAIFENALKKVKNIFHDIEENLEKNMETPKNIGSFGFATASGKKVAISEDALKKAKNLFQDCDTTEENVDKNIESDQTLSSFRFDTASCKNVSTPTTSVSGFSSASGKKVIISEEALKRVRNIFEDNIESERNIEDEINLFATEKSSKKIRGISESEENKSILNTPKNDNISKINQKSVLTVNKSYSSPQISSNDSTPILRKKSSSVRNSKKRSLGVTPCKQIDIPENTMKRAKLVFDELDIPIKKETTINNNHLQNVSPFTNKTNSPVVKTSQKVVSNSIPTISNQNKNLLNSTITMKESNRLIGSQNLVTTKISPVKRLYVGNEMIDANSIFVFQEKTTGDTKKWNTDLQKELEMLKLKMSVIETRMMMLNKQQEIIDAGSSDHRRQRPGYLFTQKLNSDRLSLKEAVNNRRPEKNTHQICLKIGLDPSILEIISENSSNLHFHVPWWPNDGRTYPAVIRTEDSAVVIPNQQNYVGVTELERAFLAMPGVDPSLLPKKWVSNHYRWIVWKLASLERNFPDIFKDCLTVESVISQLKYRYDREIDRAQRPAIRKIVECDDTAAKRMVLCVATIIKIAENTYELELTDGWYSIKTILDGPLNNLVERNVIKNGVKLAIQGAELLNCEGCDPLELPVNVRLQIHYNSTRRASWHAKLGYQPNPGPLRISLRMISGTGGPVGEVSGYIARLYPISFMERSDVVITWRNQRAELRRANQWEASYANTMENMQMSVQQELEKEWAEREKKSKNKRLKIKDVNAVNCGRTLYQFIEDSNDPDSVKELLTQDQISALQGYQTELNMKRQSELTKRLRQKMSSEKIQSRNVSTVLKLLLVDVQSPYHHRMLSVWRPTETHTQLFKEGIVINIYNVTAKNNGTLSSIPRTQFAINSDIDTTKFENTNRFVIPICQISNPSLKPQFGEFDTVGMVVTIDVRQTTQMLWLADEKYRFLMVKIREGAETCSLFDGVSPGKIIAVMNLIHQKPFKFYGEAVGNHYTVLSSYPQQAYVQDFMQEFIENLSETSENVDEYLEECRNRVEEFSSQNLKRGYVLNPLNVVHSEEETETLTKKLCGVETTQTNKSESLTLSDEEMAQIDTQLM